MEDEILMPNTFEKNPLQLPLDERLYAEIKNLLRRQNIARMRIRQILSPQARNSLFPFKLNKFNSTTILKHKIVFKIN